MDSPSTLPTQTLCGDKQLVQWNGFWYLPSNLQGTQQVLTQFNPLSKDVILASFPKTGTTWLKALLYSIINRSSRHSLLTNHPHLLVPTLEIQLYGPDNPSPLDSFAGTATSNPTRILATHIPYQHLSETVNSSDCRIVYIARNPKDTLVSLWRFVNVLNPEGSWPLEMAVNKFCNGVVPYGPYFDHVLGYKKESLERPSKVFFMTYEELQSDPKTHVKRVAEFLGCPFDADGDEEEVVEEIVRNCSFGRLRNYEVNKSSAVSPWMAMPYNVFFRQGEVGDHKNYLNAETIKHIDTITAEHFHDSCMASGI